MGMADSVPGHFKDIHLAADVHLLFGGVDRTAPQVNLYAEDLLESYMRLQDEQKSLFRELTDINLKISSSPRLVVYLQSALPVQERPSLGFIAATWCRSQLSLLPDGINELLAMVDFLTLSLVDSGAYFGSTAVRHLKLAGKTQSIESVELEAVFSTHSPDAVRTTGVMNLFFKYDNASQLLLNELLRLQQTLKASSLKSCLSGLDDSNFSDCVMLLQVAHDCLSDRAELDECLRQLNLANPMPDLESLRCTFSSEFSSDQDGEMKSQIGVELYECAVNKILQLFSTKKEMEDQSKSSSRHTDGASKKLTVVEVCSIAPVSWAKDTSRRPKDKDPEGEYALEDTALHVLPRVSLRRLVVSHIFDSLWASKIYGQSLEGGSHQECEQVANEMFRRIDQDGNGVITFEEFRDAMYEDDGIRQFFDFDEQHVLEQHGDLSGEEMNQESLRRLFSDIDRDGSSEITRAEWKTMCFHWKKKNLHWWYLYQKARENVDQLEGRTTDKATTAGQKWAIYSNLVGLDQETGLKTARESCMDVWAWLASSTSSGVWADHCALQHRRASQANTAGVASVIQRMAKGVKKELLTCEKLFIKIACDSQNRRDRHHALSYQLAILDFDYLVGVWENLFPKLVHADERELQSAGLLKSRDFIEPRNSPKGSGLRLTCEGHARWERFATSKRVSQPNAQQVSRGRHPGRQLPSVPVELPGAEAEAVGPAMMPPEFRGALPRAPEPSGLSFAEIPEPRAIQDPEVMPPAPWSEDAQESPFFPEKETASQSKRMYPTLRLPVPPAALQRSSISEPVGSFKAATPASLDMAGSPAASGISEPVGSSKAAALNIASSGGELDWSQSPLLEEPRKEGGLELWGGFNGSDPTSLNAGLRHWEDGIQEDFCRLASFQGKEVRWVSASRLRLLAVDCDDDEPLRICSNTTAMAMREGVTGDRWLTAAVAAVAELDGPISAVFEACRSLPCWPGSLPDADGPYELKLYCPKSNFQTRVSVMVNDLVPCFRQRGTWRPCFASSPSNELWPMLLEKGIASLLGGYSQLNGHMAPMAWAMITGYKRYKAFFPWPRCSEPEEAEVCWGEGDFSDLLGHPTSYSFKRSPLNMYQSERIWEQVRLLDIDGGLVLCTFKELSSSNHADMWRYAGQARQDPAHYAGDGLLARHCYPLLAALKHRGIGGQGSRQDLRLVQLRNLWGELGSWTGDWSMGSKLWDQHPEVATAAEALAKDENTFWMPWEAFRDRIQDIVCSSGMAPAKASLGTAKADPGLLWSPQATRMSAAEVAELIRTPRGLVDLWQDLSSRDPDLLQQDLSSFPDGFSDAPESLDAEAFPWTDIRWISASRVHQLIKFELQEARILPEELPSYRAWAAAAAESGPGGIANVCEEVSADIVQAGPADTWLVAALQPLADLKYPITRVFAECPDQPFEGKDGPYWLCLFDPGNQFRKVQVSVNDRVPCYARYGNRRDRAAGWRPCFSSAIYREMWPMLLEKALALLLGGYHCLATCRAPVAWAVITGETRFGAFFRWSWMMDSSKPTLRAKSPRLMGKIDRSSWGEGKFDVKSLQKNSRRFSCYTYESHDSNNHSSDWVWERLRYMNLDSRLLSCRLGPEEGEGDGDDGLAESYSIVAVKSVYEQPCTARPAVSSIRKVRKVPRAVELRFVQLRSPLPGPSGWQGRWSPGSKEWHEHPAAAAELAGLGSEDGRLFWMGWEDFQSRAVEILFSETPFARQEESSSGQRQAKVAGVVLPPSADSKRAGAGEAAYAARLPTLLRSQADLCVASAKDQEDAWESPTAPDVTHKSQEQLPSSKARQVPDRMQHEAAGLSLPSEDQEIPPCGSGPPPKVVRKSVHQHSLGSRNSSPAASDDSVAASPGRMPQSLRMAADPATSSPNRVEAASVTPDVYRHIEDRLKAYREQETEARRALEEALAKETHNRRILEQQIEVDKLRSEQERLRAEEAEEAEKRRIEELRHQKENAERRRLERIRFDEEEAERRRIQEVRQKEEEAERLRIEELRRQAEAEKQQLEETRREAKAEQLRLEEIRRQEEEAERRRLEDLRRQEKEEELERVRILRLEEQAKKQRPVEIHCQAAAPAYKPKELFCQPEEEEEGQKLKIKRHDDMELGRWPEEKETCDFEERVQREVQRLRRKEIDEEEARYQKEMEATRRRNAEIEAERLRCEEEAEKRRLEEAEKRRLEEAKKQAEEQALQDDEVVRRLMDEQKKKQRRPLSETVTQPYSPTDAKRVSLRRVSFNDDVQVPGLAPHEEVPVPKEIKPPQKGTLACDVHMFFSPQPWTNTLQSHEFAAMRSGSAMIKLIESAFDDLCQIACYQMEMKQIERTTEDHKDGAGWTISLWIYELVDLMSWKKISSNIRKYLMPLQGEECYDRDSKAVPDLIKQFTLKRIVLEDRFTKDITGEMPLSSDEDDDLEPGGIALEAHLVFVPRCTSRGRRRATITEDRDGNRFIEMLEEALEKLCQIKKCQFQFKNVVWAKNVNGEKYGWNVSFWLHYIPNHMPWDWVCRSFTTNFMTYHGDAETPLDQMETVPKHELFENYSLVEADMKALEPAIDAPDARHLRTQTSSSSSSGTSCYSLGPSFQDTFLHEENATIRMHFQARDTQGNNTTLDRELRRGLAAFSQIPEKQIIVSNRSSHVEVSMSPEKISIADVRYLQRHLMSSFTSIPQLKTFFERYKMPCVPDPTNGMCNLLDPQPKMSSLVCNYKEETENQPFSCVPFAGNMLIGSRAYSRIIASAVIVLPQACRADSQFKLRSQETLQRFKRDLAASLDLEDGAVYILSVDEFNPRWRVVFEVVASPHQDEIDQLLLLHARITNLDEQDVTPLISGRIKIDAIVCSAGDALNNDLPDEDKKLCVHLDVEAIGRTGGQSAVGQFQRLLEDLAVVYDFQNNNGIRPGWISFRQTGSRECTIDFSVQAEDATQLRVLQEMLSSLHKQETCDWHKKDKSSEFFNNFKVKSGARICASLIRRDNFRALAGKDESLALWAEINVIDELDDNLKGAIDRRGTMYFAALLRDYLHVLADVQPSWVSVLSVQISQVRRFPDVGERIRVYKVKFEIDLNNLPTIDSLANCQDTAERGPLEQRLRRELQHVYEAVYSMHCESTRRRWGHLPILQQFHFAAPPQTCVSKCFTQKMSSVDPNFQVPKIMAHVDLLHTGVPDSKAPHEDKRDWDVQMKKMLVEAVAEIVDVKEDLVVVTCITIRPAHSHRQGLRNAIKLGNLARKSEHKKDHPNDADLDPVPQEVPGDQAFPAAYTVEFEVLLAEEDQQKWHEEEVRIRKALRQLDSAAVYRRRTEPKLDALFEAFVIDQGLLFTEEWTTSGRPHQQHLLQRLQSPSNPPAVFGSNIPQSDVEPGVPVLYKMCLNLIQTKANQTDTDYKEDKIRIRCVKSLENYLQDAFSDDRSPRHKLTFERIGFKQGKNELQCQGDPRVGLLVQHAAEGGGSKPAIRFCWEGIFLLVTGVRKRAATTDMLRSNYLERDCRFAELDGGLQAFAVDLELRRIANSEGGPFKKISPPPDPTDHKYYLEHSLAEVTEDVVAMLRDFALEGDANNPRPRQIGTFEIDRGVSVDAVKYTRSKPCTLSSEQAIELKKKYPRPLLWPEYQNLALEMRTTLNAMGTSGAQIRDQFEKEYNLNGQRKAPSVDDALRKLTNLFQESQRSNVAAFVDHSISSKTVKATMVFGGSIGTLSSEDAKTKFKIEFPGKVSRALGVELCQLEVDMPVQRGLSLHVAFSIKTLSHAPAINEVKALNARLDAMREDCLEQTRWWCKVFAPLTPTSVTSGEPLSTVDSSSTGGWAVNFKLSGWLDRDLELIKGVARQLGLNEKRPQLCTTGTRLSRRGSRDMLIPDLSKEEASLLKAHLERRCHGDGKIRMYLAGNSESEVSIEQIEVKDTRCWPAFQKYKDGTDKEPRADRYLQESNVVDQIASYTSSDLMTMYVQSGQDHDFDINLDDRSMISLGNGAPAATFERHLLDQIKANYELSNSHEGMPTDVERYQFLHSVIKVADKLMDGFRSFARKVELSMIEVVGEWSLKEDSFTSKWQILELERCFQVLAHVIIRPIDEELSRTIARSLGRWLKMMIRDNCENILFRRGAVQQQSVLAACLQLVLQAEKTLNNNSGPNMMFQGIYVQMSRAGKIIQALAREDVRPRNPTLCHLAIKMMDVSFWGRSVWSEKAKHCCEDIWTGVVNLHPLVDILMHRWPATDAAAEEKHDIRNAVYWLLRHFRGFLQGEVKNDDLSTLLRHLRDIRELRDGQHGFRDWLQMEVPDAAAPPKHDPEPRRNSIALSFR